MKISSCYQAMEFKTPEDVNAFIDMYGLNVVHHYNDRYAEVYVVEDNNHNRGDLVLQPGKSIGSRGLRINVDNLDEAVAELKEKGCVVLLEPYEEKTRKVATMKDPLGTVLIVYQHCE